MSELLKERLRGLVDAYVAPLDFVDMRALLVDKHELRLVLSGLKRLRHQIKGDIARQKRDGWKPATGHLDNNVLRLQGVDRLLKRYDLHKKDAS